MVVTVKPFAFLAGPGVPAVGDCLLECQATPDNSVRLVNVWSVEADNLVGGHGPC